LVHLIQLTCQNTKSCDHQINKPTNQSDFSDYWMTTTNNDIENINGRSRIDVTLKLKDMEQVILPLSFIQMYLLIFN